MPSPPRSFAPALTFILLIALIWIALGVLIAVAAHPAVHLQPGPRAVAAGLSIGAGCAALVLVVFLRRRGRLGYFATLTFLAASLIAVVFDEVGWADLIFVAINITPVILLLKDRAWYLRS